MTSKHCPSIARLFVRLFARRCARLFVKFGAALPLVALCACSALGPSATPVPTFNSLNGNPVSSPVTAWEAALPRAPTLIINPPRAAAGFDSQRIIYLREPHKLEYFAHSEWVEPPARMLGPLMVAALQNTGAFRAVVLAPGAASGDLRLDSEIVRLQHEFQTKPSQVHFTLRAYLLNDKTRRVLAWREFDVIEAAAGENPYGGVLAANRAAQTLLDQLAQFCAETARTPPLGQ